MCTSQMVTSSTGGKITDCPPQPKKESVLSVSRTCQRLEIFLFAIKENRTVRARGCTPKPQVTLRGRDPFPQNCSESSTGNNLTALGRASLPALAVMAVQSVSRLRGQQLELGIWVETDFRHQPSWPPNQHRDLFRINSRSETEYRPLVIPSSETNFCSETARMSCFQHNIERPSSPKLLTTRSD